jgi:hypothetical protein
VSNAASNSEFGVTEIFAYKLQMVITPDDRISRNIFAVAVIEKLDENNEFLRKIIFSDEIKFQVSGRVIRQNVCIWGPEHPHATVDHIRDSPKGIVWCGLLHGPLIGRNCFTIQQLPGYAVKLRPFKVLGTAPCRVLTTRQRPYSEV